MRQKLFLFLLFFPLLLMGFVSAHPDEDHSPVIIYFFWIKGCPHCAAEKPFLEKLQNECSQIEIKSYELKGEENFKIYQEMGKRAGVPDEFLSVGSVPLTIINDRYFLGFKDEKTTGKEIREYIDSLIKNHPQCDKDSQKTITVWGKKISFSSQQPLLVLGALLGLVDGINPCMFSVLLFLLSYLLAIGSKKKAINVGLVFSVGVFITYFLFMLGMLNLIVFTGWTEKIKIIVAVIVFIVALIMIKDFFFYGKWISLEIPPRTKPLLEKLTKRATIASALILAFISSFVELPCTSGIPLVYVTILAENDLNRIFYLFWYNLFFVVPLLVIIFFTASAWAQVDKIERWRKVSRRYMRLVAGLLLIFLSLALFFNWF